VKKAIRRLDGTTLVELLVAVVFIGICVTAIVNSVTNAGSRAVYGRRRILMLSVARAELERAKSTAKTTALTPGTTFFSVNAAGFTGTGTETKTIALISGYTNLYKVTVSIAWTEKALGINRSDSLALETWVRAPDA
jgi:Tfp pilus assembly protein PilV